MPIGDSINWTAVLAQTVSMTVINSRVSSSFARGWRLPCSAKNFRTVWHAQGKAFSIHTIDILRQEVAFHEGLLKHMEIVHNGSRAT